MAETSNNMSSEDKEDANARIPMMGSVRRPSLHSTLRWMRKNLLLILTILGVILGVTIGFIARGGQYDDRVISLVQLPGDTLVRMLKMLILPLVISSVISGLAQLDPKTSGKMGLRAIVYYFSTTIFAAIVGIILVVIVHPGDPSIKAELGRGTEDSNISSLDASLDVVRNIFPENVMRACFQQGETYDKQEKPQIMKLFNDTHHELVNETDYTWVKSTRYKNGTNVLGMSVFCIAFGTFAGSMGPDGRIMVHFFVVLNEIVMRIANLVMWYSPIGIMSLIIGNIMAIEDLALTVQQLGLYMLTVIVGFVIHGVIILPLIYFAITRKNPLTFFKGILQAWLTALGTASRIATLPITFKCLEENNDIDCRVTRFVLPVATAVNIDGTALYEAVAAVFIAQLNGIHLSVGEVIAVCLVATVASIGAAGVARSGLVSMLLVLASAGLPIRDLSMIVAVDWLLDRIRASVNVLGDAYGAGIVYHLSRKELDQIDAELAAKEMVMINTRKFSIGARGNLGSGDKPHSSNLKSEDESQL